MVQNLWDHEKPVIKDPPPGKKVKEILKKMGHTSEAPYPIAKYAEGVWIQDLDDNILYDFISGRCTVNVGHRHQEIMNALKAQMNKVTHCAVEDLYNLEKSLDAVVPLKGTGNLRASYALSGSAANDAAIKMARMVTGRKGIICFAGAYHGTTYGALSVSSYVPSMVKDYGRLNDIFYFPYPDYIHPPFGKLDGEDVDNMIIGLIEQAIETYMPPEEIAAVLFEPVAGDAGWLIPSKSFVRKLEKLAQKNDILFISEEVQTGFGRTGKWFCTENYDVTPDIVVLGKAMAGGAVAMAGAVAKQSLLDKRGGFSHAHTMGRQPLGLAATLANIDVIKSEGLLAKSRANGEFMMSRLMEMQEEYECVVDSRGIASLIGVEISSKDLAGKIALDCYRHGVYIIEMGYRNIGALRVAPPLVSSESQLENALVIIGDAIKKAEKGDL
ncbi:aspartate aminotransferase family protein [Thermoproteota archaeon]